jgi:signal transduction histidine kinase
MAASDDLTVLLVCPLGRDAELVRNALHDSSIQSECHKDVAGAVDAFLSRNVGALVIAEESLATKAIAILAAGLAEQPAWSDLPVFILTGRGKQMVSQWQRERDYSALGKITLLERPMRIATLVSSVKAALRARSRQYERRLSEETLRKTEKLAVVGRLASSIAHEINNPLAAATNLVYLLSGTALDEQQQQYVDAIQKELDRVAAIASQTLTLNRQSTVQEKASVPAILDSVLALFQNRLANSQITVERRFQNSETIFCYPGELRQVFANIIGNALDATRTGGRIILHERVEVHPRTGQHGLRITVADTGHGMSAAVKAHLFEAFTSTKGNQGTGLGLWVSKGIIDKHRGVVRVRSSTKPGHSGTVFSIFIPLDRRVELAPPTPSPLQAAGSE